VQKWLLATRYWQAFRTLLAARSDFLRGVSVPAPIRVFHRDLGVSAVELGSFREIIRSEELHLSCALCEERKEKRFCPAVHGKICPQCCGEQREVTLDCPSDCPYLLQAREQAREHAHNGRPGPRDGEAPFPADEISGVELKDVEISEQFLYEREELLLGLSFALAKSARAERSLTDRDLMAALSSLAKSYQTLVNSSLICEPQTANLAHQSIAREIETMVREFREAEKQQIGHTRLRDSDVLKALVFLLRMGLGRTSGRPKSRAFVDFLFAQFPEKHSAIAGPEDAGSRIVIP
jgi:hypothetical protein